jgi:hypothetical protein
MEGFKSCNRVLPPQLRDTLDRRKNSNSKTAASKNKNEQAPFQTLASRKTVSKPDFFA